MTLARALKELRARGVLMLQDKTRPSLATIVAGEPVSGSWWGHARGREIFAVASALEDHEDVVTAKLVDGKVTFVHRDLWPALAAVGGAVDPSALSKNARALLARVQKEKRVRTTGAEAKELEVALACASETVHTEKGAHATDLISWDEFTRARALALPPVDEARAAVARAIADLPSLPLTDVSAPRRRSPPKRRAAPRKR